MGLGVWLNGDRFEDRVTGLSRQDTPERGQKPRAFSLTNDLHGCQGPERAEP